MIEKKKEMREEELVDIKFRLFDGSDMGPFQYSSASTIDMLKQRVVSDWPKGFLHLSILCSFKYVICAE